MLLLKKYESLSNIFTKYLDGTKNGSFYINMKKISFLVIIK